MVHAQGKEFWVIDLGSANGTYLNGRRVTQPTRLSDKDQLKIGDYTFTFCKPEEGSAESTMTTMADGKTIQVSRNLNCWLLLADIESSTQFLRNLPPGEGPRATGRWLSECKQIIDDHGGAINKFLGDGFFAYWTEEDGQSSASKVAGAFGALRHLQVKSELRFRLVVHYGKVVVGGAASLGEESLLGNEVNFAFRIEKVAGANGISRMFSEPAAKHLGGLLKLADAGAFAVPSFDGEHKFFTMD